MKSPVYSINQAIRIKNPKEAESLIKKKQVEDWADRFLAKHSKKPRKIKFNNHDFND